MYDYNKLNKHNDPSDLKRQHESRTLLEYLQLFIACGATTLVAHKTPTTNNALSKKLPECRTGDLSVCLSGSISRAVPDTGYRGGAGRVSPRLRNQQH